MSDDETPGTETPKPPPEEDLPDTGEPVTDAELDELEQAGGDDVQFLEPGDAADDPTVDDAEQPEQPHPPEELPDGARAADYAAEAQDGAEETPPASRGQAHG